ncbi:hypothetical protein CRG98_034117 [Punica granatum]|uniref:Uncharacterized protein n=1 Tax=Punica granatum TaxID=22663 RepID=A0A2I0IN77_PUNGR|nr:hypothetical protein CRG98_034117 [Punica granatum]
MAYSTSLIFSNKDHRPPAHDSARLLAQPGSSGSSADRGSRLQSTEGSRLQSTEGGAAESHHKQLVPVIQEARSSGNEFSTGRPAAPTRPFF